MSEKKSFSDLGKRIARRFGIDYSTPKVNPVELISETSMVYFLYQLAKKWSSLKLSTYEIIPVEQMRHAEDFMKGVEATSELANIFAKPTQELTVLYQVWESSYLKERLETWWEDECDAKGENCRSVLKSKMVKKWEEPSQITRAEFDHDKITSWQRILSQLRNSSNSLKQESPNSIDFTQENPFDIKERIVSTDKRAKDAMSWYIVLGIAFAFYEEIFTGIAKSADHHQESPAELRIARRSVLKAISAVAIGFIMNKINISFSANNAKLSSDLAEKIEQTVSQLDVSPDINFVRYFGKSPSTIHSEMQEMKAKIDDVIELNYNPRLFDDDRSWRKILDQLHKTRTALSDSIEAFKSAFNYDPETNNFTIPEEITRTTRALWATKEITNFAKSRSSEVDYSLFLSVISTALLLTSSGFITEAVLPLTDGVSHNLEKRAKSSLGLK